MNRLLPVVVIIGCLSSIELSFSYETVNFCKQNLTHIDLGLELFSNVSPNLEYLRFCENSIITIAPNAFDKFEDLERLVLDRNEELKFPAEAKFIQHDSLTDLSCFRCGVDKIYNRSLAGIPQLEQINLTQNKIEQIDGGAFQGNLKLKIIDLRWNFLQRVPKLMLDHLGKIEKVDLSYNKKLAAEGDQPFLISDSLQELWCDECGFETVYENTFSQLINLTQLHLRKNKIFNVHARAFFQVSSRKPQMNSHLMVSLEYNKLKYIDSEVKTGLQLCVYGNTNDLECFLRSLPDKDSFICSNSSQPDVECIPPTTTTTTTITTTTITTTTESISAPPSESTIISSDSDITESRAPKFSDTTSSTTAKPEKPSEEVQGISDAYISGYLTLIYVAQMVALGFLTVIWLKLKKSDPEVDRYAKSIVNPGSNYRAIQ